MKNSLPFPLQPLFEIEVLCFALLLPHTVVLNLFLQLAFLKHLKPCPISN